MSKEETNDKLLFQTGIGLEWQELSKAKIRDNAERIFDMIQDGNLDPLKTLLQIKKGKEMFDTLDKKVRPLAEAKTQLARGEVLEQNHCSITQSESGVSYDYSTCNDPEWNQLNEQLTELGERKTRREVFLKGLDKSMDIVVNEAEVVTIHPPVRKAKLGLKIELK